MVEDRLVKMIRVERGAVVKRRRGGGSLIHNPPVFSPDSEYVYLNSDWGVKVFSIKTGECVRVFETVADGLGSVLSLVFYKSHLVISTLNESSQLHLLYCDQKSFSITKNELVTLPKSHSDWIAVNTLLVPAVTNRLASDLCIVVKKIRDPPRLLSVLFYSMKETKFVERPLSGTYVEYDARLQLLSFGGPPDLMIMATVVPGVGLNMYSLDGSKETLSVKAGSSDLSWTCVCCHPTEPFVAAGDSLGRCVLFRSPLSKPQVRNIFHWHTLPCQVIAFSPAGSTMYTGGGEHVLVKWNLENPNVKNFLPRLSAPLIHLTVSPDNSLVAVSTLDNSIVLVESCHRVKRVLQQLAWGVAHHSKAVMFPAGLSFNPLTRSLLLNSRPGHLQFFYPETEVLTTVDICQQNYLTQERNKVIVNSEVTRVDLSSDSMWMATVETRQDKDVSLELKLKLWQYNPTNKTWSLNSVVDMPHGGLVNCVKFRSVSLDSVQPEYLLVTTGEDDMFRLWSPSPIDSIYKKGVVWKCEGAAAYKDLRVGPARFSQDGSLLAVGFQHIITLWSSDGILFKTSLSNQLLPIKHLEFGRDLCSHLLVCTTREEVYVWNLLTVQPEWAAQVGPTYLVSDPQSIYMAVISKSNSLYVFNPLSHEPVHVEKNLVEGQAKILGVSFASREVENEEAPLWLYKSILYYIDSYQELRSIESTKDAELSAVDFISDEEKSTLFADLKRVKSRVNIKKHSMDPSYHQYGIVGATAVNELLRASCHTMAPVSTLCSSLLQAFAMSKKCVKEREIENAMETDEGNKDRDEGISDASSTEMQDEEIGSPRGGAAESETLKKKELKTKVDDLFVIDLDEQITEIMNS